MIIDIDYMQKADWSNLWKVNQTCTKSHINHWYRLLMMIAVGFSMCRCIKIPIW